jgi:hypothetical protein
MKIPEVTSRKHVLRIIAHLPVVHARTQGNPFGVTSGSHGTCTTLCTTIVRKKRGENPDMRRTCFHYDYCSSFFKERMCSNGLGSWT